MVYISVVSHGHSLLMDSLNCIPVLAAEFNVVVKNNTSDDYLVNYCTDNNITLIDEAYGLGFSANNNFIYNYCVEKMGMKESDYFVVLNPDVAIEPEILSKLISEMSSQNLLISAINLFKDHERTIIDPSIRRFPTFFDFVSSFLFGKNETVINRENINHKQFVDWAAGSFLCFSSKHFKELHGFDEGYFMYCEDIDICLRSFRMGQPVAYFPNLSAIHLAKHENRSIFSWHFYWHIKSVFRYLLKKNNLIKLKSSVL